MLDEFNKRIQELEKQLREHANKLNGTRIDSFNTMHLALVVDTLDPLKQNRVRFFSPFLHTTKLKLNQLPWANPISSLGGFDDCGASWVPPAGSTVALIFESGHKGAPYYIGTVWQKYRGQPPNWPYPIEEYDKIHAGHRKGYLQGPDEQQSLPPWNTESYNGADLGFDDAGSGQDKLTYANIYGFKTPQKHGLKFVDGDYKCAHKNKRVEVYSSCGNWIILKDDHLHEFKPEQEDSCPESGNTIIKYRPGGAASSEIPVKEGKTPGGYPEPCQHSEGGAKYFKHKNELRPWKGPKTPQNNKIELPQSGIQFLSIAGHSFVMDDSVDQPTGKPEWEKSMETFDFGCNNKFKGKTFWKSATGHKIELNDEEEDSEVRNENNGIKFLTACGNKIELNDHSINTTTAGEKRGIHLETTSQHTIKLIDEENQQSQGRKEGGSPMPKAKKAYIQIRSGYGLEIKMDDGDQSKTDTQSIRITSPQKDNTDRGPHILNFQEASSGPGQVFLKVGGNYSCYTYDNHVTIVGNKDKNPASHITTVSKDTVMMTEKFYFNMADMQAFIAKKIILLMAGQDCPQPGTDGSGPCPAPVLCLTSKGIVASDRVFVSASDSAPCLSIFHLLPFHNCSK